MTHKFNIEKKQKLDSPKRRELLPPLETLKKLHLYDGAIVADIGCGIGYFTLPAAEIVGSEGKVYALDVSEEMLDETRAAAIEKGYTNIELIKSGEYDLMLEDGIVTYCFICNVLHEIDDLSRFVKELRRILKSRGKLVIIEWKKLVGNWGPPIEHRLDSPILIDLLNNEGFVIDLQTDIGDNFYSVVAIKEDRNEE